MTSSNLKDQKNKLVFRPLYPLVLPLFCGLAGSLVLKRYLLTIGNDWLISLVFFLVTDLVFSLLFFRNASTEGFPAFLLASIVIRLLSGLCLLVVLFFVIDQHFRVFSFHFLLHFFLFTLGQVLFVKQLLSKRA